MISTSGNERSTMGASACTRPTTGEMVARTTRESGRTIAIGVLTHVVLLTSDADRVDEDLDIGAIDGSQGDGRCDAAREPEGRRYRQGQDSAGHDGAGDQCEPGSE